MAEEIVEFLWDCPSCQNRNLGRYKKCQQCRAPIPDDIEWIDPGDSSPAVTDAKLLEQAGAGVDWTCAYCGGLNSALSDKCRHCLVFKGEGENQQATEARRQRIRQQPEELDQPVTPPQLKRIVRLVAGGAALLYALYSLANWRPHSPTVDVHAKVSTVEWSRRADIERRIVSVAENWRDLMPEGATVVKCTKKYRGTEDVVDHYRRVLKTRDGPCDEWGSVGVPIAAGHCARSLGNGFGTRSSKSSSSSSSSYSSSSSSSSHRGSGSSHSWSSSPSKRTKSRIDSSPRYERATTCLHYATEQYTDEDPVYRTQRVYAPWCRYEYPHWDFNRTLELHGTTETPSWPDAQPGGVPGPDERVVHHERYAVTLQDLDGPRHWTKEISADDFWQYRPEQKWKVTLTYGQMLDPLTRE